MFRNVVEYIYVYTLTYFLQKSDINIKKKYPTPFRMVLNQLYLEFTDAYYNPYLLKYGIWSVFSTGVFFQVNVYVTSDIRLTYNLQLFTV